MAISRMVSTCSLVTSSSVKLRTVLRFLMASNTSCSIMPPYHVVYVDLASLCQRQIQQFSPGKPWEAGDAASRPSEFAVALVELLSHKLLYLVVPLLGFHVDRRLVALAHSDRDVSPSPSQRDAAVVARGNL